MIHWSPSLHRLCCMSLNWSSFILADHTGLILIWNIEKFCISFQLQQNEAAAIWHFHATCCSVSVNRVLAVRTQVWLNSETASLSIQSPTCWLLTPGMFSTGKQLLFAPQTWIIMWNRCLCELHGARDKGWFLLFGIWACVSDFTQSQPRYQSGLVL